MLTTGMSDLTDVEPWLDWVRPRSCRLAWDTSNYLTYGHTNAQIYRNNKSLRVLSYKKVWCVDPWVNIYGDWRGLYRQTRGQTGLDRMKTAQSLMAYRHCCVIFRDDRANSDSQTEQLPLRVYYETEIERLERGRQSVRVHVRGMERSYPPNKDVTDSILTTAGVCPFTATSPWAGLSSLVHGHLWVSVVLITEAAWLLHSPLSTECKWRCTMCLHFPVFWSTSHPLTWRRLSLWPMQQPGDNQAVISSIFIYLLWFKVYIKYWKCRLCWDHKILERETQQFPRWAQSHSEEKKKLPVLCAFKSRGRGTVFFKATAQTHVDQSCERAGERERGRERERERERERDVI